MVESRRVVGVVVLVLRCKQGPKQIRNVFNKGCMWCLRARKAPPRWKEQVAKMTLKFKETWATKRPHI